MKPNQNSLTYAQLAQKAGEVIGTSSWTTIDQQMINSFADLTGDHGFIHVDPEAAAKTSFGGTIAHGLLTLSLSGAIMSDVLPKISDRKFLVNYGYDKIRFLAPVPVGSQIRGTVTLVEAAERSASERSLRYRILIEIKGAEKPAMIAENLVLVILADEQR